MSSVPRTEHVSNIQCRIFSQYLMLIKVDKGTITIWSGVLPFQINTLCASSSLLQSIVIKFRVFALVFTACLSGNTFSRHHRENGRNWPQKSKGTSVILERNVTFLCSWLSPVFQSASYQEVLHNGSKLPETQSQTFGTEVGADRGNCVRHCSQTITFATTLRFNNKYSQA